jgi:hypothetical protein
MESLPRPLAFLLLLVSGWINWRMRVEKAQRGELVEERAVSALT